MFLDFINFLPGFKLISEQQLVRPRLAQLFEPVLFRIFVVSFIIFINLRLETMLLLELVLCLVIDFACLSADWRLALRYVLLDVVRDGGVV